MKLPYHPALPSLAAQLRDLAALIEEHGRHDRHASPCRCVPCLARLLSARGWPTRVGSDGLPGAPQGAVGSSTERAVVAPPLKAFIGIDERIAKTLRVLWMAGLNLQADVSNVLAHGSDDDALPAGSGECLRCGHFCRPDREFADRIKAGFCRACYMSWYRAGRPDRTAFVANKAS